MKKNFIKLVILAALGVSGVTAVYAEPDYSPSPAVSSSQPTANQQAAFGYPSSGVPSRVITIDSGTKHINVVQQENVQIDLAGKRVVWNFDTLGTQSFPLSKIIPGADNVTVYVSGNPLYRGT